MEIAILSDIHDHLHHLRPALADVESADALLCCGDLCSPFVMTELGANFSGPVHVVWGNNDGDRFRLTQTAAGYSHIHLHGEFAELQIDDLRIAAVHFDGMGRALARSPEYDIVCYGHNHQHEVSEVGETIRVNPGEIMGGLEGESTYALLKTTDRRVTLQHVEV